MAVSGFKEDEVFKGLNYSGGEPLAEEHLECEFVNCNFRNVDLSARTFEDCRFVNCELSGVVLQGTALKTVAFEGCKILGVDFNNCHDFLLSMSFKDCTLDFSIFYSLKLPKTKFIGCHMHEVDLAEADLSEAIFTKSDLHRAVFEQTNLQKADFRAAINYEIDPEMNRVRGAQFSKDAVAGLLAKYQIRVD